MLFDSATTGAIEEGLEIYLRGRWRRLGEAALSQCPVAFQPNGGWSIRLPPGTVACPGVEQLWLLIDHDFPRSQPKVIARGIREDGSWPHVEGQGVLCLKKSCEGADAAERVVQHIAWAIEVLNLDQETRQSEFQREFWIYWHRSGDGKRAPKLYSLVAPIGPSREVCYCHDLGRGQLVFGEDPASLESWFKNTGRTLPQKAFQRSWMIWLNEPLTPASFPQKGRDVIDMIPEGFIQEVVRPGSRLPLLMGAVTQTGPVLVSTELSTASEKELAKGFRPNRLPFDRVLKSMLIRAVRRFPVERADAQYVHGRDHDPHFQALARKRVTIVGCGALGGAITRTLAQAGVAQFILIDPDYLEPHNTSRHVLGSRFVGRAKVDGMAKMLCEDFPHKPSATIRRSRVEQLSAESWKQVLECDLIISSGVDFKGDAALNRMRREAPNIPVHVCAWAEPFALAGQCVALFGGDDLIEAFDVDSNPRFESTSWPEDAQVLITEAGCGNAFQPHGAVDLQRIATTAARLSLDILQGQVTASSWRTWYGDRDEVIRRGGALGQDFQQSNTERSYGWRERLQGV